MRGGKKTKSLSLFNGVNTRKKRQKRQPGSPNLEMEPPHPRKRLRRVVELVADHAARKKFSASDLQASDPAPRTRSGSLDQQASDHTPRTRSGASNQLASDRGHRTRSGASDKHVSDLAPRDKSVAVPFYPTSEAFLMKDRVEDEEMAVTEASTFRKIGECMAHHVNVDYDRVILKCRRRRS